jgi:Glyceraldehyde-3-phosphate dehydrogenase/erythrose-4-phosphate dehydrogenase
MAKIRVGSNGFGRIVRTTVRALTGKPPEEVVAIHDLTDPQILIHVLKYNTACAGFPREMRASSDYVLFHGQIIGITTKRESWVMIQETTVLWIVRVLLTPAI